ncbi:Transposase [Cohaesibacter sp. ES.047]|uniref:IS21 family transposase n=2 Tax=Cohaesibacter sp. ES.047 TaxID=1798205 RepID=UPI000BB8FF25|nr:IS21 family transposase [Cohaesibacter sp. ES.047]SNY89887.1 Transposase [Cohaesibacter sp. ES.047]SNY90279.1 Transposase [Cohaesibacter sp. ES.047]SNY90876.1 Transposase [Cohaesibacter sp. ES.047]SNY91719.1 Transposase [Cohaesibacter sp. ES.047]SNY92317.1 Transposase [Cohaesibacter sp. ES.047]
MKRLPMRKIREALRLRAEGLSGRRVAQSLSIGRATISDYFRRADLAGLAWPLPVDLSDSDLELLLYPSQPGASSRAVPQPDWAHMHAELRRKGVTLALLWQEYREVHPDGYGYSQYCARYSAWEGKLSPVMRQRHPAGERLFVDYAGQTVDVICPQTGEVRTAQIFVATLGASNYTYVEASWTQSLPDWISSHVRAFDFFGGVPAMIVSDNLKSAVIKACFHDPAINRTYGDMAAHYDTAVVPARPHKPKDKAKVETAVQLAERWVLARLRNQTFFGLDELNAAIRPLQDQLNAKVTRHLGTSRRALFESLDKPAMKPVPREPYVYAEWKQCRAGIDYHIDVDRHYYSVPYQLIKQRLWVRVAARTIEVFHKGQRVASHVRISGNRQHSTQKEHMPSNHRHRADWTPESIRRQAVRIGPNVDTYVEVVMRRRKHPEQAYRSCMGVLKLARSFGNARLDAACERALEINSYTYQSLHSILKNGLDRQRRETPTDGPAITHPNIRGADYFH